jgi:hypothetical protein
VLGRLLRRAPHRIESSRHNRKKVKIATDHTKHHRSVRRLSSEANTEANQFSTYTCSAVRIGVNPNTCRVLPPQQVDVAVLQQGTNEAPVDTYMFLLAVRLCSRCVWYSRY